MDFGNVRTETGQAKLNEFLTTHSYLHGVQPSNEDATVYGKLFLTPPPVKKFPHAHRWFTHMSAFTDYERESWKELDQKAAKQNEVQVQSRTAEEDLDLFGDETEEERAAAQKAVATAKKATEPPKKEKKPVINKSQIVFDVKPVSVDQDLTELEKDIRMIKIEGLEWSQTTKHIPLAFGLMKLQIGCTIVDSLVSVDEVTEQIECIGLTPEQAAEKRRCLEEGDEDIDEEAEEEETDPPGKVMSAEIVSFNKI